MLASPFTCVLWDVDGTLVDASEGILGRLIEVHEHYGRTPPTRDDLIHWIGPPMFETFQLRFGMTPEQAREAVTHYRSLNKRDGTARGARTFPGMTELVAELHALGVPQATASSKPENQVIDLMDHFGLTPSLTAIVGASPDERSRATKTDVIREALRQLDAAGVDVSRPVLVGDRHHDIAGGAETGVPVIFVRWGFSDPSESDGAAGVAATPAELRSLLLREV
ncbi:HAD hydrolase-like protein [Microbacterium gorillae]|uniref:HAD hydrolase-like protein n=1 Tax=Microbacterium gorillae TaxID=1231063 RepID=UPI000590AF41|nr:HAD hydrolase-like protein [Microbacterium gorillae]